MRTPGQLLPLTHFVLNIANGCCSERLVVSCQTAMGIPRERRGIVVCFRLLIPHTRQQAYEPGVVGSNPAGRANNQGLRTSKPSPRRFCGTLAGPFIHRFSLGQPAESFGFPLVAALG